jgi:hypothetical protein
MRRRLLLLVGFAVAVLLAFGLSVWISDMRGPLERKLDEVQIGMTRSAVNEILGEPNLANNGITFWVRLGEGCAMVPFDNDIVVEKRFHRLTLVDVSACGLA